MTTPVQADVFKFLATRPAQRFTEKEAAPFFVRDSQAATPKGAKDVEALARKLSPPGAALAHWKELDLTPIKVVEVAYRDLLRSYERLAPGLPAPDGKMLMKQAGLDRLLKADEPALVKLAWEALYTAHATGAAAGPMLEGPMGALRALHFNGTLADQPNPPRPTAIAVLRATVVISPTFDAAFRQRQAAPEQVPMTATVHTPESTRRSAQIRSLASIFTARDRLMNWLPIDQGKTTSRLAPPHHGMETALASKPDSSNRGL